MHPITHLLTSWVIANSADLSPRDTTLVTLSGVAPDVDGLGIIAELATVNTGAAVYWWTTYHHVLCHNLCFGLVLVLVDALLSVRRWVTALLAFLAFHLHLLCDLVGSRGIDGYQWPIPTLFHFRLAMKWFGMVNGL